LAQIFENKDDDRIRRRRTFELPDQHQGKT
jgi:hypothetical protein